MAKLQPAKRLQQGRRSLTCAAMVDGEVVSVAALELALFCGFSIPRRQVRAQLWKPASRPIENRARHFSYR